MREKNNFIPGDVNNDDRMFGSMGLLFMELNLKLEKALLHWVAFYEKDYVV